MYAKLLFAVLLVITLFSLPPAYAQDFTIHQMKFSINGPVEFPGRVLQAGTYFIRRETGPLRQGTDNVIEVLDKDRQHVLLTTIGIDARRNQPLPEPFEFYEATPGAPPAVRSWYLPGTYNGYDFVYPKERARVLARGPQAETAEIIPPPEPMPEPAPAPAMKVPEEPAPVAKPAEPLPEPMPEAAPAPAPVEQPKELPKTAGELPLIAFLGFVLLVGFVAVRLSRSE